MASRRNTAIRRLDALRGSDPRIVADVSDLKNERRESKNVRGPIPRLLHEADLNLSPAIVVVSCLLTAKLMVLAGMIILPTFFLPLAGIAGGMIPLAWLDRRAQARAAKFAEEYPSVLLAAASSIKAGMTAQAALERSVQLLPKTSLVRLEVERLLAQLTGGLPKEVALAKFASNIRQPDLELFRRAFVLVLDHGGRFAPTLERLARVCRDRAILIRTAKVSTATMRMTANILLAITPLIMLMIGLRTKDFWTVLTSHPVANLLASIGAMIIISSYLLLRRMSNFRP